MALFVSCSDDKTAKRWMRTINNDNNLLQLLGTYRRTQRWRFVCDGERRQHSPHWITSIKHWRFGTKPLASVSTLFRWVLRFVVCWKRKTTLVLFVGWTSGGRVEMRRVSDLGVLSSFKIHEGHESVVSICELEDGSFVSADWVTMKRWDEKGTVLQTFSGHSNAYQQSDRVEQRRHRECINRQTVKMWKVSTGECLRTLTDSFYDAKCVWTGKGEGRCVCKWVLMDKIVVWDEKGECIETHQSASDDWTQWRDWEMDRCPQVCQGGREEHHKGRAWSTCGCATRRVASNVSNTSLL